MSGGGFDWPALMRAGLQGMGLRPDQFWCLTPAEFLMMHGETSGAAPMGRDRLEALAARFPDRPAKEGKDGPGR